MKPRHLAIAFLVLLLNTAYISSFPSATVFYVVNVLLHLGLGIAIAVALIWVMARNQPYGRKLPIAGALFGVCATIGILIAIVGNTSGNRSSLWLHIAFGAAATVALLVTSWRMSSRGTGWMQFRNALTVAALFACFLPFFRLRNTDQPIRNTLAIPTSMQEEGSGPNSPFWPSSANTNTGKIIPSNFFMDSKACGECHKDIYDEWNSSVHHFASFNNQFYRKSIEHMQDLSGVQGSKWCAACHDHAVFFNGRFEKPIKDQIDTPEAQNGLGCMSCHSIVHVGSTMGNSHFTVEYPPLHELASSRNPIIHAIDYFTTYLNPAPHKQTFLKPFMKSAEFCSACHKVHLDVPVNNYRWLRGFNDYDNWQASGVSGQGARSFYYPPKSSTCADCHMPLVDSKDPGNHDGKVHSHRFAAANTAVAVANQDAKQLSETEKFLKSGFITVDIFAASSVDESKGQTEMRRRSPEGPQLMSTFAVGEESEQSGGQVILRDVGKLMAPIEEGHVAPGSTVRIDTVVRTRKIGHFFPAGTVDSFDVWLELQGRDATGKLIFWSGKLDEDGSVEPGAHFYRSYQLDGEGNPINKRNAWQTRSVLYVRLIPPGAADVAHFRVKIPKDARGPITFSAKLNYRKFTNYFTKYAYAGQPKPGQSLQLAGLGHDSREYSFDKTSIPKNVSGRIKDEIPVIPIITVASAKALLPLGDPNWQPLVRKKDRERWNDWGIGLLLQGDLKGAEYAFKKVTEAEPGYADGWLNVARALIQEGETDAAKPYIEQALKINASLGRIHFFKAMIQKTDGDYDGAIASLNTVIAQYPRDRVALNQLGRMLFLKRQYPQAVDALNAALSVDPEDVQAHYTLMLAYRGLHETSKAQHEEKLFRRFKADESSQSITAKRRLVSPEDNNERQPIHDHESAIAGGGKP